MFLQTHTHTDTQSDTVQSPSPTKSVTKHLLGKRKKSEVIGEGPRSCLRARADARLRTSFLLRAGPPPSSVSGAGAPSRPRLRPRPAADVSCYVSARAAVAAGLLLRRRRPRPREVTGASGTAARTRGAFPSGVGAARPGDKPIAAPGAVSSLFFFLFFLEDLRSARPIFLCRDRDAPSGAGQRCPPA